MFKNKAVRYSIAVIGLGLVLYWLNSKHAFDKRYSSGQEEGLFELKDRRQAPAAKDARLIASAAKSSLDPESVRDFVKESSNSAEATASAYLLTHNPVYLEGLKSHPDSESALQILAQYDGGCESRLYWAEQLQKKNPANGMAKLLIAKSSADCGKSDLATAALLEAGAQGVTSSNRSLRESVLELLDKLPPSKRTEVAVRDVVNNQLGSTIDLFPENMDAVFRGKTQEEAQALALEILKLTDRMSSDDSFNLLDIEGFSNSSDAALNIRMDILMDFEKVYGEGTARSIDPNGLEGAWNESRLITERKKTERYQLTPQQVDERVRAAMDKR